MTAVDPQPSMIDWTAEESRFCTICGGECQCQPETFQEFAALMLEE